MFEYVHKTLYVCFYTGHIEAFDKCFLVSCLIWLTLFILHSRWKVKIEQHSGFVKVYIKQHFV